MTLDRMSGLHGEVADAVHDGTYEVDPLLVADAILARWTASGIAEEWIETQDYPTSDGTAADRSSC